MKLSAESTVINDGKLNTNIDNAQNTADQAKSIADNTAQNFWFKSSGTDTGAHITEISQAEFEANPRGGNLLARSNGIAIRDGLDELSSFSSNEIDLGNLTISNDPTVGVKYNTGVGLDLFSLNQDGVLVGTTAETKAFLGGNGIRYFPNPTVRGKLFVISRDSAEHANIILCDNDPRTSSTRGARAENCSMVVGNIGQFIEGVVDCFATGAYSFAQGCGVQASGNYSSAMGLGTKAEAVAQCAVGKWNDSDASALLVVGKGTGDTARSNAMVVTLDGDILFADDTDISTALTELGW